jgi:hypothetical protein
MRELPEYYDFLRAIARQDPWSDKVEFMLVHRVSGKPNRVATSLLFSEVPEGALMQPTFRLLGPEAQELMDMLWNCGLRPTQSKQSIGQLEAVERHLADMRTIAFNKLEIDSPCGAS